MVLIAACSFYAHFHQSWWRFALWILVPDLSMLGYLAGKRVGTVCYNIFHTYSLPLAAFLGAFCLGRWEYGGLLLIWVAHIGADRFLGYGIKYEPAFRDTHLQRV
jgi:hypothetical protein